MPTCLICNKFYERKPVVLSNNENGIVGGFNCFKEAFNLFGNLVKARKERFHEDEAAEVTFPIPSSIPAAADDHPCCELCLMKLLELQRHQKIIDEAKQAQNESVSNFLEDIDTSSEDSASLNPMWGPLRKTLIEYSQMADAEMPEAITDLGTEIEEDEEAEIDYHFNYKQEPEPSPPPPPPRQRKRKRSGRPSPPPEESQAEYTKVSRSDHHQPMSKFKGNDKKIKVKNLLKCETCEYTSNYKSRIVQHSAKHKKTGKLVRISKDCPKCGLHFTSESLYLRHISQNHGPEKPIWTCDEILSSEETNAIQICGKIFPFRSRLLAHKLKEHEMVRWRCNVCQIDFSTPTNLTQHKKTRKHLQRSKQKMYSQ